MKNALVVVDYQKDFVDGSLGFSGAEKLDSGIAALIEARRSEGYDIIFTLDTHSENYLSTAEGRALPIPHCIEGSDGHALYGQTAKSVQPGDRLLTKPTFGSDKLFFLLREEAYQKIELVGLVSNICVISNAVIAKTACPEAEITVRSGLTGSSNPELNQAALDVLRGLLINIEE